MFKLLLSSAVQSHMFQVLSFLLCPVSKRARGLGSNKELGGDRIRTADLNRPQE